MKLFPPTNFGFAKTVRVLLIISITITFNNSISAQSAFNSFRMPNLKVNLMETNTSYISAGPNNCGNIGFDPAAIRKCVPTGSFIVNYTGFSPQAEEAFQYAIDIWSRVLILSVPIEIDAVWEPLLITPIGAVLGSAGPQRFAATSSTVFPIALVNQLIGADFAPTTSDISASFNSAFTDWYFGLDGCPPANQIDFVTTVLHEVGHGLGFFSLSGRNNNLCPIGSYEVGLNTLGFSGFYIFDQFLNNSNPPVGFVNQLSANAPGCYTVAQAEAYFTNGALTFNGPETMACTGGPTPIYAPSAYVSGTSTSHFDELTYAGVQANSLMTPFLSRGEAVHDPGCALAVLRDIGYNSIDAVPECAALIKQIPTMSQWGLLIYCLLILNIGTFFVDKQEESIA